MAYPERLLPRPEFKIIADPDPSQLIVRHVPPEIDAWDEDNELQAAAVLEEQIFGYSSNKIPPSNVEDIKIEIINKKCLDDWSEGLESLSPKDSEYRIIDERGYFLLRIGDIHKYADTYPRPDLGDNVQLRYTIILKHRPLLANYSHFEFAIYDKDGNKINKSKSKWKQELMHIIRSILIKNAKKDPIDFSEPLL